jgi:membrane-bound lytic murein transglycosylase B
MNQATASGHGLIGTALFCLLLAGCAHAPSTDTPPPAPMAMAPATTPAAPDAAGAAQPPAVEAPQTQAVDLNPPQILALPANPEPDSYAYREDARRLAQQLAAQQGLESDWAWQTLSRARFKESITRFIMPPPAGTPKNWTAYRGRFVEPIRIRAGVQFWREHRDTLSRAESDYGVPASVIVGVLGVETLYGRQMGNFKALDALATLSLDFPRGRSDRSSYFQSELGQLLKWCKETGTDPDSVMASYAGAIGMPQFMPGSVRRYAVDFDRDGRVDLLRSPADAIGSVAAYLSQHGWVNGLPGYFEVTPPSDLAALQKLVEPDIRPSFTAAEMRAAGARLAPDLDDATGKLALVALQNGENPPVYVAGTRNFYAVTRYNQSSYYALAVLQLGDAVQKEAERSLTQAK